MSSTLKHLGIDLAYFPRDQQDEAVEQISMLRMEQILMGEGQIFDWDILMKRPDLIEVANHKDKHMLFHNELSLNDEDSEEWPYAEVSLFAFTKDSPVRLNLKRLLKQKYLCCLIQSDFQWLTRFVILVNVIAFSIYDYENRLGHGNTDLNRIAVSLEVVCNIYFGIEAFLQIIVQGFILEPHTYMRNLWNIVNFITFLCSWSCLADAMDESEFIKVLRNIRLLRALRIIHEIPQLKSQMDAFVKSFMRLGPILIPLIFVMLYYSIVGLHLFSGVTENRCRESHEPEDGKWPAVLEIKFLCGIWECPEGYQLTCGNPADHDIERDWYENDWEEFNFYFSRFDSFFYSLFVVFTYLNIMGWSGTNYLYWKAMTSKVTAFYFVTLIFLLAFILSNLLLASFYESFLDQSSIKQNNKAKQEEAQLESEIQKKRQQQMMDRLAVLGDQKPQASLKQQVRMSLYFSEEEKHHTIIGEQMEIFHKLSLKISKSIFFVILNLIMITICSIALCVDRHGISKEQWRQLQLVDFICTIYFFFELVVNIWGKGFKGHLKKFVNKLDTFVILSQAVLFIYVFVTEQELIYSKVIEIIIWKTIKILRIVKLLYSAKLFHDISVLTRCLFETLAKMKNMIFLWLCLVWIIALYGRELLAYRVRFTPGEFEHEDIVEDLNDHHAFPPRMNYEGFGNSIMAAMSIFYNEEWHVAMFKFARVYPFSSIIFYVICILVGQVLFIRLYLAVFLNEFCKLLTHIDQSVKPAHEHKQLRKLVIAFKAMFSRKKPKIHSDEQAKLNQESASPNIKQQMFSGPQSPMKSAFSKFPENIQATPDDHNEENQFMVKEVQRQPQSVSKEEDIDLKSEISRSSDNLTNKYKDYVAKTFFVFSRENKARRFVIQMVQHKVFNNCYLLLILAASVRNGLSNPLQHPDDKSNLMVVYAILTAIFALINILNIMAFGLISAPKAYLRQSPYNVLSWGITIYEIFAVSMNIKHPLGVLTASMRILQFIQIGAKLNKEINYAQISLFNAFGQMIQLVVFCFCIFIVYGVFGMKLMKGKLYYCSTLSEELVEQVHTKWDCMDLGGSWVNQILTYDTISDSICMLFVIATTEGWDALLARTWSASGVDQQPILNYDRYWGIYFFLFFFLGNLCMLNMFIGLIVNSYAEGKLHAQHLHLLDATQREWFFIKESIFNMKPLCKSIKPTNPIKKALFFLIKNQTLKKVWLIIIACNTLVLCLHHHRMDEQFRIALMYINNIFIVIFLIEIMARFIAKEFRLYTKDLINVIDIVGIWVCIANMFIRNDESQDFYFRRCFGAASVAFQLVRNYKIVKRFNEIERLFSSIFSVIPSALSMMYIMTIFLYLYTVVGQEMFAYLRPQFYINGWDAHFKTFSCGMFSLMKVASIEQWYGLLSDSARTVQPDFACVDITNYDDFVEHGFNGCGTKLAYLYYISFHLIFSILIVNIFIASVLLAYEEHVKSEESAVSKYQLNDVLDLWVKYDNRGLGFINYKNFWKLSSEIAIIFGVDQSDLLDQNNKKNFLKVLNIPIYEYKQTNMLCYRFHDVILSLTKISVTLKYGVTKYMFFLKHSLEPTDKEVIRILEETHGNHGHHSSVFKETDFTSGNMVTIIYIQGKVRAWKQRALNKNKGGQLGEISDLGKMFKGQRQQ